MSHLIKSKIIKINHFHLKFSLIDIFVLILFSLSFRTECLKLLVAVSILKVEDLNERAEMIYRWIQIAIDTKTAMGNLYGFTGIMLGLCVPEVNH